jgi:hypothetical protein
MLGGQAVTNSSQSVHPEPAGALACDREPRWRRREKSHSAPPARAAAPPDHFVFAPMAGHHAIEPIAKSIAEIACDAVGFDLTPHQTLVATPESNRSSGGRGHPLEGRSRGNDNPRKK